MSEAQGASRAALAAAFLSCTAIWSSTFLFIRLGNATVPPLWAAALRLGLAGALLWIWVATHPKDAPRGAGLRPAVVYGFLQFGINFPLLYWSETVVPSGLSAVMYANVPLATALMAHALGVERVTRAKILGSVSALAGVAIIFASELSGRVAALPLIAGFVAPMAATLGTVLLKRGPAQSAIGVNALGCAIGFVLCLALSVVAREPHALPRTMASVFPILYLTVAGSLGAFVLWAWLVHHAPISRISYIAVLVPLCALVLGAIVAHERMPPLTLAGSAVVLIGVGLGMRAPAPRTR